MKTTRFLSLAFFAVLFFTANVSAMDFGKLTKKAGEAAKKASADLEQIAKKLEKLQSDKINVSEDERGVVLTFSAQLFAVGKADLTDEAKENLLETSKTLAEYPDANVEIEGHTDSTGSAKLNQDLSERRAKNVMLFLIELGTAKEKLNAVGYGKDRPIADNKTEIGRATNRRVELIVKMKVKEEEIKEEIIQEEKEGIRFGVRANLGIAGTYPNEIQTTYGWGGTSKKTVESGTGYGLGGFALIPFISIYFVPEVAIQHREPISNFEGLTVTETAIEIPLMFRFRYREENLIYLGIGPFYGVVLDLQDNVGGNFKNYRSRSDVGLSFELGFRINENFSIDLRSTGSFTSFGIGEYLEIGGETPTLIQGQIGLSYIF